MRKWKMRGLKMAAGWCQWKRRQLVKLRGEFVEDVEDDCCVKQEGEADADVQLWVAGFGYRRKNRMSQVASPVDMIEGERGPGA